ncbi:dipeptidase [Rothia sp. AR01]|uniref:Dipeptidase n=1 Tax=Rothia santali TaxID=2949643 RepID=A0A9X2HCJ2_9MICC|nr:dipeptidase [Rothia santali]MCP3424609.1 dipeptidase [Rothia santali]
MTNDEQHQNPDEHPGDRGAAELRESLEGQHERILAELAAVVEIPSVAWDVRDAGEVWRSARAVAQLAEEAGLPEVEILTSARPDGEQGMPAVVARRRAAPGQPTVMLYAHHDVQPVSDPDEWDTEPFRATPVGDRLYGRGAADDKAGVMVHIAAVRALLERGEEDPGIGITLFVEGEEEAGSPSFESFLAEHRDRLAADAIVVADSANWKQGVPALTTSLRGVVSGTVRLRALGHALHSGVFGGPLVDANTAMVRLLASLHDDDGAVAVSGLVRAPEPELDYPEEDFRRDAGVPDRLRLTGRGSIASRLWSQPALSVIGMDITPVDRSSNTLAASSRARISLRLAPGQDPHEAHRLLEEHLRAHAPWGAEVEYEAGEAGSPFEADTSSPAARAVLEAMRSTWGVEPALTGLGGSIPFVASLTETFPDAAILITGVEDPDTRAHSANESLYLPDFFKAIESEATFLLGMARTRTAGD